MNPTVLSLGPLEIRAFAAWVVLGLGVGAGLVLVSARRLQAKQRLTLMRWADVLLAALVGGIIGARFFHVVLNWDYFAAQQAEIWNLRAGGLDWHGALIVGMAAALIAAFVRRVPVAPLTDAFALALPILAAAGWRACMDAACGYGVEVGTLANYPAWLVTESADIYGTIAPRLNLPVAGILLTVPILLVVLVLMWRGWFSGLRFWLALMLYGIGMMILSFFRAEYVPLWLDHRADQLLDALVVLLALMVFVMLAVRKILRKTHLTEYVTQWE